MPEDAAGCDAAPRLGSLRQAISRLAASFRAAGIAAPELDARLLVLAAAGLAQEDYVLEPGRPLASDAAARLPEWQARRLAREPVSRILGRRDFWGRSFRLSPATLDPRPETETLIEAALGIIGEDGQEGEPLRLLDLGTGTGCILLTLLAELPAAWGLGIDIAPEAALTAAQNARDLGLSGRAAFLCGDWTSPISGAFHYILANPPYVRRDEIAGLEPEVRCYDPWQALDGGEDGYHAYLRIAGEAYERAAPGAWLLLEAGAGQASYIADLLAKSGWGGNGSTSRVYADLLKHDRVVAVRKHK